MISTFTDLLAARDRIMIAPSLLAADFSKLGEEMRDAEAGGADMFHLDIMDGHFVPNLTLGPPVMKSIRPVSDLPVEAHLMITDPVKYAAPFVDGGADAITFHVEVAHDPVATAGALKELGVPVGASLNPPTPLSDLERLKDLIDYVLIMTVNPGFGGQSFMREPLEKVEVISREWGLPVIVDGGVTPETAPDTARAGATILVAGTAVFGGADRGARIDAIRNAAAEAAAD
ncbi:MAG: ribulose-phosphate 3-epimerase [Planctomycetota bacterium]|jgi:ribulose-phosphate 3-epimerase